MRAFSGNSSNAYHDRTAKTRGL